MRRLIGAVVVAMSFGLAHAQETTTGTITGTVVDSQGAAIPGATVNVESEQGVKTFVTDSSGGFFAPFLTPDRYSVRVVLEGFSPVEQRNIDVRLGARVELPALTLKVGGLQEAVEVVGSAPVIDTNSTTVGGRLASADLGRLPVGRNFMQATYLVPGVTASDVGSSNPSVGGASGLENNYVVDGVNITNSGYGAVGSYSIVFGSLGSGVTTDFVKETQVKTAGFEAEYGQSTGGVVNVVTQSGTNALHGSVFGYLAPMGLGGDPEQITIANGAVNTTGQTTGDFGASLAGPLVKDRLFFFGTVNPQFTKTLFVAPPTAPLASLGEVARKRRSLGYASKLTYQAGSSHRLDLSVFGDPSKAELGPQRNTALLRSTTAGFSEINYGGHNQVLKYDGILSPRWLLEASIARATNKIEEIPSVDEWAVTDRTVVPLVGSGGIGFYEQGNQGTNYQYQVKSTHIVGQHQIRYGALYEDIDYNNINQRTGPTITLHDGQRTATGVAVNIVPDGEGGRIYRVISGALNTGRETRQQYVSFFLQDTWNVSQKLTIRPGLRYEQQKLIGSANPPLCREGDTAPGFEDGTGQAVACEFKWSGNFGPRLGVIYDPTGTGKAKLFGSFGRFYAKIPNDLAARALSADAGITRADFADAALTQPIHNGTLRGGTTSHFILAGLHPAKIDPDSKSTYQDEVVGGIEYEVGRGVNLGVRYTYRNLPRVLEDVGTVSLTEYFTNPDQAGSVEYFITNPSPETRVDLGEGKFEDPIHHYHAVELTANKTFSDNWSLVASYRWSRLSGSFEGFYRSDNGQSDPAISSLYDFPTNDPSYARLAPALGFRGDIRLQGALGAGVLPNDRTHQLKLYGAYAVGRLSLGLGLNLGSGRPLTALAANPVYDNGGEIPESPRGGGIQTVADGFRERTRPQAVADVHADYALPIRGAKLVLIADVFNILDRQVPTHYGDGTEVGYLVPDPDFGAPINGNGSFVSSYSAPRQVRLGARFEW